MKFIFTVLMTFLMCGSLMSQTASKEQTILYLEKEWTRVLDKNDTINLKKYWTEDYVVNNATGKVVRARDILNLMKSGHQFPKVDRHVERITFNEDLAVVMGSEVEYGKNGKKKNRRFTNIWRETKDGWKLVARQANGN